jgi:hypothetical protein
VNADPTKRLFAHGWLFAPAVCCPIGAGMIKIGGGGTWAAAIVGAAPYAIYLLFAIVFALGYFAALARFLCSGPHGQEAMTRLIEVSANAFIAILTLRRTVPTEKRQAACQHSTSDNGTHPSPGGLKRPL